MSTTEIGLERLSRLADFLESQVDPLHYDMRRYGNITDSSDPSFVGCALGHASRLFTEEKFEFVNLGGDDYPYHTIRCGNLIAGLAVQDFFGITSITHSHLFGVPRFTEDNPTPTDTAAKIREYITSVKSQDD